MRAPVRGDVVLHWVAGMQGEPLRRRFLWGRSRVARSARVVSTEPPEPGVWAGRGTYYRIDLTACERLIPPRPLEDLERALSQLILLEVGSDRPSYYPYVRYRDGFRVAQGIYLTLLSSELAHAYNAYFVDEASTGVRHDEGVDRVHAFAEGERSRREANFFRRNPRLRRAAIERHGLRCAVCEFDFGEAYGDHGQGYVEMHHLRPLAEQRDLAAGAAVETTVEDVVPLCANCHRMAHRGRSTLAVEELRAIWKRRHPQ